MGYGGTDADERSPPRDEYNSSIDLSEDELSIVPKGTLDPVYESKARLLNRAVSIVMQFYLLIPVRRRVSCLRLPLIVTCRYFTFCFTRHVPIQSFLLMHHRL